MRTQTRTLSNKWPSLFLGILIVGGVILAGTVAQAQDAATVATKYGPLRLNGAVGLEVHNQDYREPSASVSEKGWFGDLTLDGQMEWNLWQLRTDARLARGQMDYSGSGTINGIDDFVFEGRIAVGRIIPLGSAGTDRLIPYFGYGYRRLDDYEGGKTTSTGFKGYDRLSQYNYLPIGLEALFGVANGWAVKPTVEYDYFLFGNQDSQLSQVGPGNSNIHNTQNSGYGVRGSLMARTLVGSLPIEFGPFIRYWNIKQSNIVNPGGWHEPANHTTELGLAIKVWFSEPKPPSPAPQTDCATDDPYGVKARYAQENGTSYVKNCN